MQGGAPALARHPALHRDHPADGGRRARRPRRSCRRSRSCSTAAILVAHNARFDSRVLQAGVRALAGSSGRTRRCSARSRSAGASPRSRRRLGLARLADYLGIEVEETHRALPDAAHLRAHLLRPVPEAVRQRGHRRAMPRSSRGPAGAPRAAVAPCIPSRARTAPTSRGCPTTRASTCSATSAAAAVRGQVGVAAQPRPRPLLRPGRLDRAGRDRGLPAHELRARRARAREPADQAVAPAGQPQPQAHRPLRVPALPARHPLPDPRGGPRAGGRATP